MSLRGLGDAGERAAEAFLRAHGARVLARNYRALGAEIDRIVKLDGRVVFVEVKTRSGDRFGSPGAAVTREKQRHIVRAALCYLKENHLSDAPVRFDVVEVTPEGIRHFPAAFLAIDSRI